MQISFVKYQSKPAKNYQETRQDFFPVVKSKTQKFPKICSRETKKKSTIREIKLPRKFHATR